MEENALNFHDCVHVHERVFISELWFNDAQTYKVLAHKLARIGTQAYRVLAHKLARIGTQTYRVLAHKLARFGALTFQYTSFGAQTCMFSGYWVSLWTDVQVPVGFHFVLWHRLSHRLSDRVAVSECLPVILPETMAREL